MPLNHVSIPVGRHYTRMRDFYTSVLKPLGYSLYMEKLDTPNSRPLCGFQAGAGPDFWLGLGETKASIDAIRTFDGDNESTVSPVHLAFDAASQQQVDHFYENAIKSGARDNGKPGLRPYGKTYYAAFVIDPLGNNIEVVHLPRV
ncbi:glyoxalase/bleomycin resistance protein/dioxygenase [Verticillium dahliae VdLs.17]|uniref:Glyoxalase/bleomycin resistance protein/dioxygenase n=1 Tax=Verticillium dahliae (strain VdLs.17 / ATCC MYA-4575 / FGSC 10137) TaxID=498257 RepID=G2XFQ9_VERDV|nr:glyoxalase/bleomycin resistance protein/dioxygenase [Verticillium dahliae VdLs.17]EGY18657.1 glyoxalase/bleomycin resistance protein/dioxygenase [Verticillium dahliae VdLs.17]